MPFDQSRINRDTRCVLVARTLPRWRNGMRGMRALARAHGASEEELFSRADKQMHRAMQSHELHFSASQAYRPSESNSFRSKQN